MLTEREAKMKEEEILRGIKEFSRDMDWLSKKHEELRKEFADKYIAIMNRRVIDSDPDLQKLLRRLKESGKNPSEIPVEFISKEPQRLILF